MKEGRFPLLPSPSPFNLFFASALTFAQYLDLETLATQASPYPRALDPGDLTTK